MRVLVCGGRNYGATPRLSPTGTRAAEAFGERGIMCRALDDAKAAGMTFLIHGGAPGADTYSARWANDHGVNAAAFQAEWHKHGRRAGPIRNQRMLDEGKPDLVIAFPGGAGTADMVRRARAAGVEVREVK